MRAVQLLGDRQAIVRDKADPKPGPGHVLLRIRAAAICGSDLHTYDRRAAIDRYATRCPATSRAARSARSAPASTTFASAIASWSTIALAADDASSAARETRISARAGEPRLRYR